MEHRDRNGHGFVAVKGEPPHRAAWSGNWRDEDNVPAETIDGHANDCTHASASGIDTTPLRDPGKVWRCDHCGLRWTSGTVAREGGEGDGEGDRWECGPHANAWNGHDARCRRIATDAQVGDQSLAGVLRSLGMIPTHAALWDEADWDEAARLIAETGEIASHARTIRAEREGEQRGVIT